MTDTDLLDSLLERNAELLDSAAALLQAAVRQSRLLTPREQDAWEWAMRTAGDRSCRARDLIASLESRGYRPSLRLDADRVALNWPDASP